MVSIHPASAVTMNSANTRYLKGTTSTENFGTGVGVDPSDYESYSLAQVRDTLSIAGLSATKTDFNLVTKESAGFLNDPFDGIVGQYYGGSKNHAMNHLICVLQVWDTMVMGPSSRTSLVPACPVSFVPIVSKGSSSLFNACRDLVAIFSLALLPNGIAGSELTLGGIDTTKYTNPLTYVPVVAFSSFWELKSTQFAVNGVTTSTLKASHNIIFDSGKFLC